MLKFSSENFKIEELTEKERERGRVCTLDKQFVIDLASASSTKKLFGKDFETTGVRLLCRTAKNVNTMKILGLSKENKGLSKKGKSD